VGYILMFLIGLSIGVVYSDRIKLELEYLKDKIVNKFKGD
jgi:hypothetical protein